MSFFSSRWTKRPGFATELSGLPQGFQASGISAGIKPQADSDLGVIYSKVGPTTSAALFTSSAVKAPPVLLCQERCELSALRAVVVNSGNANAATGLAGYETAKAMQERTAEQLNLAADTVAVASTGVIGVQLDRDCVVQGIDVAAVALAEDGVNDFCEAIHTTDAFQKQAMLSLDLPAGKVALSAQAKGAGMIQPGFATMLCFIETDANLSSEAIEPILRRAVAGSFDRISVDGQLSTNDSVFLIANGASGISLEPDSESEKMFAEALGQLLLQLALLMVKDGEGARRVAKVTVTGAVEEEVERVAYCVANSPLVKTALHGGDPNWGRIAQAVGAALRGKTNLEYGVKIQGQEVCTDGVATPYEHHQLEGLVSGDEVEYEINLPGSAHSATLYFSDLSHQYVTINAEYTT